MQRLTVLLVVTFMAAAFPLSAKADRLNDKLLNRPYSDMRRWHLGFSVGSEHV